MKLTRKYLFIGVLFSGLISLNSGCDLVDLDINKNPNDPTNAPMRLLLTSAELNISAVFEGVNQKV